MRKNQLSFFVLLAFNVNFYLVAHLEFRIVAEFTDRDDTIALVANVYNYFALVDSDDSTFNDVVFVDATKSLVISLLEFFFALSAFSDSVFECIPVKVRQRCNVLKILH